MSNGICPSCNREMAPDCLFCPYCGTDLKKPISCLKCNYENEPNSKFCQECGAALRTDQAPEKKTARLVKATDADVDIEPAPSEGICIEFPFASAQSFDFALKEAMKLPGFKQYGQEKKAIYRVLVPQKELVTATELLEQLKGWRKRTVYLNGEKVQWDSVFSYTWCYAKKSSSYKPEYYCFGYETESEINLWGCIQAHMPFHEYGQWFCWGKWSGNKGDWEFDKDRIRHELEKVLYYYRFCPALKKDKIEAVLAAIPDVVNPTRDRNWKYVENWGDENAPSLMVTVERYGMKEKVLMKGVCPNGQGAIKDIAKRVQLSLPLK